MSYVSTVGDTIGGDTVSDHHSSLYVLLRLRSLSSVREVYYQRSLRRRQNISSMAALPTPVSALQSTILGGNAMVYEYKYGMVP